MVDRSTNTATSAPHRSHAVAGWSQAAGTPHDPTTPYLLATPQALRNSAPGGSARTLQGLDPLQARTCLQRHRLCVTARAVRRRGSRRRA